VKLGTCRLPWHSGGSAQILVYNVANSGNMKKTLIILNNLVAEGILQKYAIAGGIASLFYIEPVATFDLDLFVLVPNEESLAPLSPIYRHLSQLGYPSEQELIVIEGIPVQFLLPYNGLIREAIEHAQPELYEDISTSVVSIEYLMAVMVQTWRIKDRERLALFIQEADFDENLLKEVLARHKLNERWDQWISQNTSNT
jgi:hypothetical protein